MYPSIILEFNIAPNTQIGKLVIDHKVYDNENHYNVEEEKYSRGGEFLENFNTDNIMEFAKRWLHLANYEELLDDIDEYYNQYNYGNFSEMYYSNSPIIPTLNGNDSEILMNKNEVIDAIEFFDQYDKPANFTFDNIQKGLNVA